MRQPDKNRYLNAAKHIECEEIPFQENDIDPVIAKRILGRDVPMIRTYNLPLEDYVELNLKCGNDMVYMANVWELGRKNYVDANGRKHYVDGTMKTPADLKQIGYPDLDNIKMRIEHLLECIDETGFGVIYSPNQAPFLVTTAVGYQDYYEQMITNPAFIKEFQKIVGEFCMRELELVLSYPIDVIQIGAVICMNTGPMFSGAMIKEFEYPNIRRQVERVKSAGRITCLHSDGDVTSLIPDFIEMGIDVLNPIETCDGRQDIYRIKKMYGDRIALHGNIDLAGVLVSGTPEKVERDVIEHIDRLAVGGGYICASSHNITENVPLENFYAMRDAVHSFK